MAKAKGVKAKGALASAKLSKNPAQNKIVKKQVKKEAIKPTQEKKAKTLAKVQKGLEGREVEDGQSEEEVDTTKPNDQESSPEPGSSDSDVESISSDAQKPEQKGDESSSEDEDEDEDEDKDEEKTDTTPKSGTEAKSTKPGPVNKEHYPEGLNRKARRRLVLIDRQRVAIKKRLGIPEDSTEPNEEVDKELEAWIAKFDLVEDKNAKRKSLKVRTRQAKELKGDEREAALDALAEEKRALAKATAGLKKKDKKLREKKKSSVKESPATQKKGKKSKPEDKPKTEDKPKAEAKPKGDKAKNKKKGKKISE